MSQHTDQDVQVEIQKTLALINDTTLKIDDIALIFGSKKELNALSDLVRENGRLNIAVDNANVTLSNVIRNMGIQTRPANGEEDKDETENFMIPMTPDLITEKIMSIIHE